MNTIVIVPCTLDGCTKNVTAYYKRGTPQTFWEPGEPPYWYASYHGVDHLDDADRYKEDYLIEEHLTKLIDDDDFQARCGRVAEISFDNDVWEF